MIIVMAAGAAQTDIDRVVGKVMERGLKVHLSEGKFVTIIGVVGDKKLLQEVPLEAMTGVDKVVAITSGYKLASKQFRPENSVIDVGGVLIGGDNLVIMAGPCAVESREQLLESAHIVKNAGAQILRGGAYKPRTSPYSFQGLEEQGLKYLAEARAETGLKIVTEVVDTQSVPVVAEYADILQIGARNMQNFQLLKSAGRSDKPVLLKRGIAATIDEWLNAAEYIMNEGNYQVIMCERGIRTFETYTRNTLDLSAVAVLKNICHLPVIVDPSHGTGHWKLVRPMSRAAVAAGADGLIIEVHPKPDEAMSDGMQSLTPENFTELMNELRNLVQVMGRKLA